ncbi:DCC1-like thiol-disulfide oxidoreductase family protein [Haladaptatus sp. DYF46]|uniref:DCC1-like thiol-disulfide oxidoreductase family protein n=1 Tax=Haladaptatus sp. DYF46 TaxID=2886041 RepID=UPI001E62F3F9|nr:DCC1-like thiol-disulfide oxidoreductase family protein [Haladaptatus sp. DYF46]
METATPRLVYDDDCGFCTWVAEYADDHGDFELVGFSDLTPDQRARLPAGFEECAHLLTDERVYSCGAAMEEVIARLDDPSRHVVTLFRYLPESARARIREPVYRWNADRRAWWGKLLSR